MELAKAKKVAAKYVMMLTPYCERISIAGSIRRERPEVKDIEIVIIPKEIPTKIDLFTQEPRRSPGFIQVVNSLEKVKGEPTGKYTQRRLLEGINLDLFMITKENWGLQIAIRTGSAEFSHKVLATGWTRLDYTSHEGILWKEGTPVYIHEEKELFDLLGLDFIEPPQREVTT